MEVEKEGASLENPIAVPVQIVRWVDDYQPGIVECCLTDAQGRDWVFIEKLPMVTDEVLDETSTYPRPGVIACEVLSVEGDRARIDTSRPWQSQSVEGETHFEVRATVLTTFNPS